MRLNVIGAPSSAGAYGPGQENAPAAFRRHGLLEALSRSGVEVADRGDAAREVQAPEPGSDAGNAAAVVRVARDVAGRVTAALDDGPVLVLGGDCTVEIGTVAGAVAGGARVGLVYVDRDTDLTTRTTGDGILDWMGVAHLLDLPDVVDELAGVGPHRPLLTPEQVFFVGVANVTPPEQEVIDRLGIPAAPQAECLDDPAAVVQRVLDWASGLDRLLVHVDIDVLDHRHFPIAENTRTSPGLDIDTLERLVVGLCGAPAWAGLTLCEVNPAHADDEAARFQRLIGLLDRAATQADHRAVDR